MSKTMITISLSRKDAVLNTWWNHYLNISRRELALMALEHYLKTGNYLCIGKIIPRPIDTKKLNRILLYTTQSKFISDWINEERAKNSRKLISEVRRILYRSIEQVSYENKESIPSPYDDLEEIVIDQEDIKPEIKHKTKITKKEAPSKAVNNSFAASLVNSIMADNPAKLGK